GDHVADDLFLIAAKRGVAEDLGENLAGAVCPVSLGVTPAKAGVHRAEIHLVTGMDPGFRRGDAREKRQVFACSHAGARLPCIPDGRREPPSGSTTCLAASQAAANRGRFML